MILLCILILIIEVLSKSREAFDRGEKFIDYQTCPTLEEYVLITQSQRKIECYWRESSGFWSKKSYKADEEVEFRSVNYRCPIDDIYRKVPGLSWKKVKSDRYLSVLINSFNTN
jgi:Uma2 family endonuclease